MNKKNLCLLLISFSMIAIIIYFMKRPPTLPKFDKLTTIDLVEGKGKVAMTGSKILFRYNGYLTNNKKIDSNYDREIKPVYLGNGELMTGFEQGIPGMKEGGKRKIQIPSDMAFGGRGSINDIPSDASVIYEVELEKVF